MIHSRFCEKAVLLFGNNTRRPVFPGLNANAEDTITPLVCARSFHEQLTQAYNLRNIDSYQTHRQAKDVFSDPPNSQVTLLRIS